MVPVHHSSVTEDKIAYAAYLLVNVQKDKPTDVEGKIEKCPSEGLTDLFFMVKLQIV